MLRKLRVSCTHSRKGGVPVLPLLPLTIVVVVVCRALVLCHTYLLFLVPSSGRSMQFGFWCCRGGEPEVANAVYTFTDLGSRPKIGSQEPLGNQWSMVTVVSPTICCPPAVCPIAEACACALQSGSEASPTVLDVVNLSTAWGYVAVPQKASIHKVVFFSVFHTSVLFSSLEATRMDCANEA